ncbi:hypothetical protein [uncultured Clostridium sp.]|uniref:hypothetical protein n=1 Tax=uncultured Clostridium sp. TaxID=59620 RepID=UPI00261638F2|nr:hypothetical protein [uncultured Clostridium sp.]
MYNYDILETEQDIYFNSVIRYGGKDYKDNSEIYTYLIDRRFITNLNELLSYIKRNYTVTISEYDKCFIIFKVNNSQEYVDTKVLFNGILLKGLIISLDQFIIQYNVKPRYRKEFTKFNYKDQL